MSTWRDDDEQGSAGLALDAVCAGDAAQRFVDGAARRGADAIILDLEDSVAASEKERARTLVPEAAEIVSRGGADVVVRLNRPMRMTVRDLEAVIGPRRTRGRAAQGGKRGACAARRRDHRRARGRARHARSARPRCWRWSRPRRRSFASTRSPRRSPRLVALNLGAEDFAMSAGMLPEAEGLFMPKQMCVFAARAAGIMPMGFVGTVAEFHDLDGFRADGAALAPARLCRRQRHPSEPGRDPQRGVPAGRRRGGSCQPGRRRLRQGARRRGRRRHGRRQDDRRAGRRARQTAARAGGGDRRPRGEEAGAGLPPA